MNEEYTLEVLEDMNRCSTCPDIQSSCSSLSDVDKLKMEDVDWLAENLPTLSYVKDRMLSYIFSNGLATGDKAGDEKLERWLYEETNKFGSTNFAVLRDAIGQATIYGECGIRLYEGNIYTVSHGYYGVLYTSEDGIKEIVAYFVRKDEDRVEGEIKDDSWDEFYYYEDIYKWFDEKGYILLDPSEFVNLRNDTSEMHGKSPFLVDKQRTALLLNVYKRLNYDIQYDGPGRLIVRPKGSVETGEETSTASIINNSGAAQAQRSADIKREVERVAKEIKGSSSDSVIALSNGFDEKITHLPRVTKAVEFFDWIKEEGMIVSQILGMSPVLMEVGSWSGNVSMQYIIDNAMLNTIVPKREQYAVQFSLMIATLLGVRKVYFDKYDMKQAEDENARREKIAGVIRDLSTSYKSTQEPNVLKLINEFTEVLRTTVYDENKELRPL